jgi:hypothetical protein
MEGRGTKHSGKAYLPGKLKLKVKLGRESHLAAGQRCRKDIQAANYPEHLFRQMVPSYKAPPGLRERIQRALRKET